MRGWTVAVTRPEPREGPLSGRLRAAGAVVVNLPTIEVVGPADPAPLQHALSAIDSYDWIVFTSPRSVRALREAGVTLPGTLRIAAVGPSTAAHLERAGVAVTFVGPGGGGAELARALPEREDLVAGMRVLFPCSDRAGRALVDGLGEAGVAVEPVVSYETRLRPFDEEAHAELRSCDVVTFTSPSAVDGWFASLSEGLAALLTDRVSFVTIGPTTEARLADYGVDSVRAPESTLDGVVRGVVSVAARPEWRSIRVHQE